jgi:DNA-binding CsgD family transcriptional regulator
MEDLADRMNLLMTHLDSLQRDVVLAIADGDLEHAVALVTRFIEHADESGASVRGRHVALQLLMAPMVYLGRADAWLAAFDEYARLVPATLHGDSYAHIFSASRAVCLAELGRMDEALAVVGPILDEIDPGESEDESAVARLIMLLQAAIILGHRAAALGLRARLPYLAHLAFSVGGSGSTCVARQLGDAAVLGGDRAAAHAHYLQALEVAGKIRFRPELALTHVRLAELLLDGGDESKALEHLDVAIPELRDMKMQPGLEHALRLLERVGPPARASATDATHPDVLTGREQEVACLLAAGRSNREIADTLVITEGTVEVHVKHILTKLGFRSRSQVAVWFAQQSSLEGPGASRA